jgi:ubiquinone/menaquinone biosynthesis C-methylase UbiE
VFHALPPPPAGTTDADAPQLSWVEGDAEALPIASDSVDLFTIAFGIRNVTHVDRAVAEAFRVLKPGGRFMCLEFSKVENPLLRQVYDAVSGAGSGRGAGAGLEALRCDVR